ncbi:MAG: HD domain-containing phosphohydrolase [bacterium]
MATKTVPKLLFVDDELNILSAIKRLFRKEAWDIKTANSGQQGLVLLEEQAFDLVVSDMRMPEMDGAEFLAAVIEKWPKTERVLLTGYADLESTIRAVNDSHIFAYVSKPWDERELRMVIDRALERKFLRDERDELQELTRQKNEQLKELNETLEDKVKKRTAELTIAHETLKKTHQKLERSYFAAVPVFASLIQSREIGIEGHSRRTADFARQMAIQLDLGDIKMRDIYLAGLLHDIGSVQLPDEILSKPMSRFSFAEREQWRKHPVIGEALLISMEPLQGVAKIIRHHHEYYNGKGFPDKLKGEAIPLGARIISIVNDYDGLITGQILGESLSVADAAEYLKDSPHYDPFLVTEFLKLLDAQGMRKDSVHELRLSPGELQPGMVLSRSLTSSNGLMLLAKGFCLEDTTIQRLRVFSKREGEHFVAHVVADKKQLPEIKIHEESNDSD